MSTPLGVTMTWQGWGAEYDDPCIIGELKVNGRRVAMTGYSLDAAGEVQPWPAEDDWDEERHGPKPPPPEGLVRMLRRQAERQRRAS